MTQSILNLALDFFRSPAEHDELVDPAAPLPPDVSSLLDVIAGAKDPSAENSLVVSDEMRAAISFLIEQSFFIPGADYYRVLGLNRGAPPEQIRKNYNQLMHIFLLKGEDGSVAWDMNHAMLVNRAYSVLRDPEQRRIYDQGLQRPSSGRPRNPPVNPGMNMSEKISYFPSQGEPESPSSAEAPAGPKPSSRSSYLAHSVDRVSSIPVVPPVMQESEALVHSPEPSLSDELSDTPFPVDPGDDAISGEFPKAVPMVEPDRHHHSPVKSFLKSALTVAVLAAIFIAVAIYILGTPPALMEEGADVAPAVDAANVQAGSVERDTSSSETSGAVEGAASIDISTTQPAAGSSLPPGETAGKSDVLEPDVELSRDAGLSLTKGAAASAPSAVSDAPLTVKSVSKSASGDKPAAVGATKGSNVERKVTEPPASKERDRSAVDMSPARRLESMRPPEAVKTPTPVSPENKLPAPQPVGTGPTIKHDPLTTAAAGVVSASPVTEVSEPEVTQKSVIEPVAPVPETLAAIAPPPPVPAISDGLRVELDAITAAFSRAYEAGDLPRLMSLFAEDASTNDQSNRQGIEKDYRDLFEQTSRRAFVFERVDWKADRDGSYTGDSVFHVYVDLKGQSGSNTLDGRVTFHVQKRAQGLVITRMSHSYE